MKFEFIPQSQLLNGVTVDAIYVPEFRLWIPVPSKHAEIEIGIYTTVGLMTGPIKYRVVRINGTIYKFHQFRYELGRPNLLQDILDLVAKLINS